MEPFVIALVAHGLIGGLDVVINHELIAKVPAQPNTGPEQRLHSARELVFAAIFFSLAWFEWHGLAALAIAALLIAEMAISTIDTVLEFDTRLLPVSERVAHVLLFVNFGIVLALLGQTLLAWLKLPSAVVAADYGLWSWILSALALGSLVWSVRDGMNVVRRKTVAAA